MGMKSTEISEQQWKSDLKGAGAEKNVPESIICYSN